MIGAYAKLYETDSAVMARVFVAIMYQYNRG